MTRTVKRPKAVTMIINRKAKNNVDVDCIIVTQPDELIGRSLDGVAWPTGKAAAPYELGGPNAP